jgi:acetate kinase
VLDLLPDHTSVLLFDTLFHQTLDKHIYTYAVGPAEQGTPVPLRKVRLSRALVREPTSLL